ncbi:MAG: hypothetical protein M3Z23_02375, partial [Acidobacteriota bacterium]|nr:hypothetical protein [Acidobacteriota bacterium]
MLSFISSYPNLKGGGIYPSPIRKTEPKPLRVFQQDGKNDRNIYSGSWYLAKPGRGWLWRDYPKPISKPAAVNERSISTIVDLSREWEVASSGHKFTEGPAVNREGNVFFSDVPNNGIHKIAVDGKVTVFKDNSGGANGLMFDPEGRLYACQKGSKRIAFCSSTRRGKSGWSTRESLYRTAC